MSSARTLGTIQPSTNRPSTTPQIPRLIVFMVAAPGCRVSSQEACQDRKLTLSKEHKAGHQQHLVSIFRRRAATEAFSKTVINLWTHFVKMNAHPFALI